jgi:hypothetical protein
MRAPARHVPGAIASSAKRSVDLDAREPAHFEPQHVDARETLARGGCLDRREHAARQTHFMHVDRFPFV